MLHTDSSSGRRGGPSGPPAGTLPSRKAVPRLRNFSYRGFHAYSLTLSTHQRQHQFTAPDTVEPLRDLLLSTAAAHGFRVWAFCFMPDHLHTLLQRDRADASLPAFLRNFKQRSSYVFRQGHGKTLWQRSYYDRVLRKDEDIRAVSRYIFENPVRKGVVKEFTSYPFSGPPETLRALS